MIKMGKVMMNDAVIVLRKVLFIMCRACGIIGIGSV